ncbi:MAG: asparagine synthase-related protein [Sphingomonas sp.]|jgi:asparagine synthase (glutamine-hydrolysing)
MTHDAYLAIVAPGADPEHAQQIASRAERDLQLNPMFQSDGLTVLARSGTRHHSLGRSGIAIGTVISRDMNDGRRETAGKPIDGRELIASRWGDYVAFLRGPETDAVTVIRAPSGGLPAFRAAAGEMTLISSDITFLLALTAASPRIDWNFVAHHLVFPHLRAAATGVADIDELFAGDGTVFTPQGTRRASLWSPWDFAAAERQITDPEEARGAVRRAVSEAVSGLVQPYRSTLLELSGGLDSSVLAAALAASGAPATAINLVTPGTEGDERGYARATAGACGLALAEHDVAGDVDLTAPVPDRLARPGIPAILGPADGLLAALGRESGVDVFVSGTGGDCVFCSPASAAPAADAWRTFGPGRRFLRAVRHVAEIHDTSLWTAGSMAWRQAHRPPIHRLWPGNHAFLVRDRLPREPDFHPWLAEPADSLPGRRSHIRAVIAAFAHLDGYARHAVAPSIFPLMSQPVMEACFRIPTWMWIDGGRDRAVARQAFRDILPARVLDRRSKGGMDAYCIRNFEANRPRLEPFLLDGHLAEAGLLDRPAVASFLRQPVGQRDQRFYRLLPIIDAEAWTRGWLGSIAAPGAP